MKDILFATMVLVCKELHKEREKAKEANAPKQVVISLQEFEKLKEDQEFLQALQAAGVDNWEGYDEALMETLREDDDDE